jgi:hypothetical protein
MGIEVKGTIHAVFETKQVSERFSRREFVVEIIDNPKYPNLVQFQLTGDRCTQLDGVRIGDQVRLEYSLRGREWRSPSGDVKYFNSLDVWKLDVVGKSARGGSHEPAPSSGGGDDDRLPF